MAPATFVCPLLTLLARAWDTSSCNNDECPVVADYLQQVEVHAPVEGVKLMGNGFCKDRDGDGYSGLFADPADEDTSGSLASAVARCANATLAAVALQPAVVGFSFWGSSGGCHIKVQPGFEDAQADWARAFEGVDGYRGDLFEYSVPGKGPMENVDGGYKDALCYEVKLEPDTEHEPEVKRQAAKACKGSQKGQVGTGQVGSTCCYSPNGNMCCVGAVAGEGGGTEVKVSCARPVAREGGLYSVTPRLYGNGGAGKVTFGLLALAATAVSGMILLRRRTQRAMLLDAEPEAEPVE